MLPSLDRRGIIVYYTDTYLGETNHGGEGGSLEICCFGKNVVRGKFAKVYTRKIVRGMEGVTMTHGARVTKAQGELWPTRLRPN